MLKNILKNFQMSEQNWGCLDKISEVNFSPAETLRGGGGGSNSLPREWSPIAEL